MHILERSRDKQVRMLDHMVIIPVVLVLTRTQFFVLGLGVEDNEEQ